MVITNCLIIESSILDDKKHYAIVGKNGVGKSTIIKLILGIYDTFDGKILVDNEDIRSLDVNFLRKNILVLNQDFKNLI